MIGRLGDWIGHRDWLHQTGTLLNITDRFSHNGFDYMNT